MAGVFPTAKAWNVYGLICHHWSVTYDTRRATIDWLRSPSAAWLKRKFNTAVKRRDEARWVLTDLSDVRNPHAGSGGNYSTRFFREQWEAQRKFHEDHTEAEEERRSKLVSYYQQEVVELLRVAS
ncbi:hypothetical protein PSTG_19177 [Puccinia striiformis f. sp. tritici PST-78]|uniref:Uncharacterized protein n=1 Tax=Puccinia striiformis f. sp. tritici PST-78 TaxID=1165861 RepID=A0A0L0UK72_9BASI|nr:hypothetical protein PSTG_19177 [Puccinia striiformis f. sp. tritici PST-78]